MATEPRYYTVSLADGSESAPMTREQAFALYEARYGSTLLAWY